MILPYHCLFGYTITLKIYTQVFPFRGNMCHHQMSKTTGQYVVLFSQRYHNMTWISSEFYYLCGYEKTQTVEVS